MRGSEEPGQEAENRPARIPGRLGLDKGVKAIRRREESHSGAFPVEPVHTRVPEQTRTLRLRPDALHDGELLMSHRRKHNMQNSWEKT